MIREENGRNLLYGLNQIVGITGTQKGNEIGKKKKICCGGGLIDSSDTEVPGYEHINGFVSRQDGSSIFFFIF